MRLALGSGATLYGWPSTGGRYTLQNPSAFELDFLGVDRFVESKKASTAEDEDAFCLKGPPARQHILRVLAGLQDRRAAR